ncbi:MULTISPECIES: hypothetical protein [Ponticoccus]|uniref:Uncharacterized protein n=1 Tax=Ponticoccus litoralis TaxID=422297 RepID=A0AAW9SG27_9RHOB
MLVLVGLIAAFILVAVFSNRRTRLCRWREQRGQSGSQWMCIHCGARVDGQKATPPDACFRNDG